MKSQYQSGFARAASPELVCISAQVDIGMRQVIIGAKLDGESDGLDPRVSTHHRGAELHERLRQSVFELKPDWAKIAKDAWEQSNRKQ